MFLKPLIITQRIVQRDILRFVGVPISRFYDALCAPYSLPNYHLSSRPDFVRRVTTSGIRSNWQFTVTDQVNLHRLETFSGDVIFVVRVSSSVARLTWPNSVVVSRLI